MNTLCEETSRHLWPKLFRYFRARAFGHEDSEDLTQETLLRVWRQEKVFESAIHLTRYAYAAARSVAIRRWRKREVEWVDIELGEACDSTAPSPADDLQVAELESAARGSLETSPEHLGCFFDPDRQPPSYLEVAERSGFGEGALRTAVCRTRRRLRKELAELLAA